MRFLLAAAFFLMVPGPFVVGYALLTVVHRGSPDTILTLAGAALVTLGHVTIARERGLSWLWGLVGGARLFAPVAR